GGLAWPAIPGFPAAWGTNGSRPDGLKATGIPLVPAAVCRPASGSDGAGAVASRGVPGGTVGPGAGRREFGLPAGVMIRDQELTVPQPWTKSPTSSAQVPWAFSPVNVERGSDGR